MTDFNKFKLKMHIKQRRKKNLMNNEISNQDDNKILIYTSDDGQVKIEVRLKDENVWLTQNAMAKLFNTTKQNISLHIKNIFEEQELDENSVVKENLTTDLDETYKVYPIVSPLVTQIISQYFHRYLTKEECLFE